MKLIFTLQWFILCELLVFESSSFFVEFLNKLEKMLKNK